MKAIALILMAISLDLEDASLVDALKQIEQQSGLQLAYEQKVVENAEPVTLKVGGVPAGEVLHRILRREDSWKLVQLNLNSFGCCISLIFCFCRYQTKPVKHRADAISNLHQNWCVFDHLPEKFFTRNICSGEHGMHTWHLPSNFGVQSSKNTMGNRATYDHALQIIAPVEITRKLRCSKCFGYIRYPNRISSQITHRCSIPRVLLFASVCVLQTLAIPLVFFGQFP